MTQLRFSIVASLTLLLGLLLSSQAISQDADPNKIVAPKILPENTLVMIRMADLPKAREAFRETALGRMGQDEQVKPVVSRFYAALQEAWKRIEENVGVPLDDLLKIPQGEICFAVIDVPNRMPAIVFLIETKDQVRTANKLFLERAEHFITQAGGTKTTETVEGEKVSVFTGPDSGAPVIRVVQREGTFLACTSAEILPDLLAAWNGQPKGNTLSQNDKFNAVMSRCGSSGERQPNLTWYVEPIVLARRLIRGSGAAFVAGLFPVLGLDGLQAVGGSMIFNQGDFDSVAHIHLLLENPRSGVIDLLALGSGDTTPEPWVPAAASNYVTFHGKFDDFVRNGSKLYNSLQGENALENEIKVRLSDNLGVDVLTEIIPALEGRVSYFTWVERPVRVNSQTVMLGVRLKDANAFKPTFEKITAKFQENLESKSFGGVSYWAFKVPNNPDRPPNIRVPEPCIAILGDYLVFSDSTGALHEAIQTINDPTRCLAQQLDYKLIAAKIRRQPGGDAPGFVSFTQPEESMRMMYDLATSASTKQALAEQATRNPFFKSIEDATKEAPLPPFGVLARYLAPGGGMITGDDTGFHYTAFTLKRK